MHIGIGRKVVLLLVGLLLVACGARSHNTDDAGDSGATDADAFVDSDNADPCTPGAAECLERGGDEIFRRCVGEGDSALFQERNCTAEGFAACVVEGAFETCGSPAREDTPIGCAHCAPCNIGCDGPDVAECRRDGSGWESTPCDTEAGEACDIAHRGCVNGCEVTSSPGSTIGCEYFAVDLDNMGGDTTSPAAQEYGVALANLATNIDAEVTVELCRRQPCSDAANLEVVTETVVSPRDAELLVLPAREVDGSPDGEYGTGAGSALGPRAYRITSTWPVRAYQLNPLSEGISCDGTLLYPSSALDERYRVLSWPQTIASAPGLSDFDFGLDLRAYLAVVATQDATVVSLEPTAAIVPSAEPTPLVPRTVAGESLEIELDAFDVLNLETGLHDGVHSFLADFSGTLLDASHPVAVFAGVEAADVPIWGEAAERLVGADHLELQQQPGRHLGRRFVVPHTPSRSEALAATGAAVVPLDSETEYVRIMATEPATTVDTPLPRFEHIVLEPGEYVTIPIDTHLRIEASAPVRVAQFVSGQGATGMDVGYPAGDPTSILAMPDYYTGRCHVFFTPLGFRFDFVMVTVHSSQAAEVLLDGRPVSELESCWTEPVTGPGEFEVVTCALSAPVWNTTTDRLEPGEQNDGAHEVCGNLGSRGIRVSVYGFDDFVSYGYSAGSGVPFWPDFRTE